MHAYSWQAMYFLKISSMNFQLEIIGFTIQGCLSAQAAGAHRIELCDNEAAGGTTPSYGFIKVARQKISIPLYPIIRPRAGNFCYNEDEVEIMKADVLQCKALGCDGVVLGILDSNGNIDKESCARLIRLAYPMEVTFHRAFDTVADQAKSLEDIIALGCERVLTSGGKANAAEGIANIAALVKQADGRIIIMPGSGIRAANILEVAQKTGATEFHSSAKIFLKSGRQAHAYPPSSGSGNIGVDEDEVKSMIEILSAHNTE